MGPVTVLILPQHFFLMALLTSLKIEEIMTFGVIIWQTIAPRVGGVTLIFHTYVGSGHFKGFKILNFSIFGGFS